MYLYRAPLDWLAQRLVAATAHPIRSRAPNQPPGLTPQRVTLRWAPSAGGAIRTQRGLLWTSHESPLTLHAYQQAGAEALLQFRPSRRTTVAGCTLHDHFPALTAGRVSATATLEREHLTVRGRIGTTPFLRRLTARSQPTGRWSLRAANENGQIHLTLAPPDRPPIQARILSFRGQITQATAQPLATGHVALTALLVMEAEWLDNQGRRRVTDWQIQLKHLLNLPEATLGELLGINLLLHELRWAPDRPVWALLTAQIARYRPTLLPVNPTYQAPASILVGYAELDFAWTESEQLRPALEGSPLEIPFDRPISRLLALDLRPGALDLLLGLKGGGLHLLTLPSTWTSPPPALTALALPGRIRLQT